MTAYHRQRPQTELCEFIVRNIAAVMEREREKRQMGKVEFAKLCGIKAPAFLRILGGAANPTIDTITRISMSLNVPVCELLYNDQGARIRDSRLRHPV